MKNKKLKIKAKVDSLNALIAKVETYTEKAREDGIIMPEEIKRFNDLLLSREETIKKYSKERERGGRSLQDNRGGNRKTFITRTEVRLFFPSININFN